MAISVIEKIEINALPPAVAAIMFDPASTVRWASGVKEVRDIQNLPLQKGTRQHRIVDFVGKEMDYILEVTDYSPDTKLVLETKSGPFPMTITYALEEAENDHCLAKIALEGSSDGFLMFLDRLSTIMVSEQLKGDLQRLKEMIEGVTWQDK